MTWGSKSAAGYWLSADAVNEVSVSTATANPKIMGFFMVSYPIS
jgi:hypothetical protein